MHYKKSAKETNRSFWANSYFSKPWDNKGAPSAEDNTTKTKAVDRWAWDSASHVKTYSKWQSHSKAGYFRRGKLKKAWLTRNSGTQLAQPSSLMQPRILRIILSRRCTFFIPGLTKITICPKTPFRFLRWFFVMLSFHVESARIVFTSTNLTTLTGCRNDCGIPMFSLRRAAYCIKKCSRSRLRDFC